MSVRTCQYHPVAYILFDTIPTRSLWIVTHVIVSCCFINLHENWQCRRINQSGETMQVRLAEVCFFQLLWHLLIQANKHIHVYVYLLIFIHESQYTICLTLYIRHQLTKMRRTHLVAPKKPNGLIISIYTFFFSCSSATPITRHGFRTPCRRVFRRTAFPPGGMPVLFRSGGHCTVSWSSFKPFSSRPRHHPHARDS